MATTYGITVPRLLVLFSALAIAVSVLQGCSSVRSLPVQNSEQSSSEIAKSTNDKQIRCSTKAPSRDRRRAIERSLSANERTPVERAPGSVTIRVHFHIIKSSSDEGGVSESTLKNQINVLNHAFAGTAPGGPGAPTPFRFELESFEEIPNDAWFNMKYDENQPTPAELQAKAERNRGGSTALDIYTIRTIEKPFGWSRFPWDPESWQGVVIDFRTLPGGSQLSFNEGDTATHEVGHWLGLFHTFENGCNSPGDEVEDTPPESGPTRMCPHPPDSCPGNGRDSINNFMNTTDDRCMFQFTAGQARRMDHMHQLHRSRRTVPATSRR